MKITPAALRALAVALAATLAFSLLGLLVAHQPPETLNPIDTAGRVLAGKAPYVALIFTISCWWFVLVFLGDVAIAVAIFRPAWRARVAFSVVTTIVAWQTSDALKNVFARQRPDYWVFIHEKSLSYPSGHAMFAIVVYGLWSYFFATSPLPRNARVALSVLFGLWGAGVIWSRLALGAHFITDLAGGAVFGVIMLAIAATIAFSWPARSLSS